MRREELALEWLDRAVPRGDLDASLADVDRLNTWFGGHALTIRHVERLVRRVPATTPLTVADVGAGNGGLAMRLGQWGRRRGRRLSVVAVDMDPDTARLARQRTGSSGHVTIVRGDAMELPLATGGADVVVSSLLLHHLDPDAASAVLVEMARVSRLGFVVNDLWRARLGVLTVWLATRLLGCHPISRHDGPLSVRRSYAPTEIRRLAARTRMRRVEVIRYPLLARVLTIGEH
jgi:ubiquinone/menaquinone biosynthesis C-methylase UbiE